MKASKALKRLAKIETLISDVMERFSGSAVEVRQALQDAKVAFARLKTAVSSQASSKSPKNPAKKKAAAKTKTVARATGASAQKADIKSAAQKKKHAERIKTSSVAKKKAVVKATPTARRQPRKTATRPVTAPALVRVTPNPETGAVTGEVERAPGTELPTNAVR
jgi:type IV secretory pathway VirB10-like protein